MTCDDFQIAIERRLHGDLGEAEAAPLDRHLSDCEACRAYQAQAREVEAKMAANASEALAGTDWGKVERGIREGILVALRGVVASVVGGVLVAALIWTTRGPAMTDARMLRVGAALGLTLALIAALGAAAAWRLARLERGAGMIAAWRRGVRLRVRLARLLHWPSAGLAVFYGWKALSGDSADGKVQGPIFYGAVVAILAGAALYNRFVKLPRALREEADLGPDPLA
jgi:hypothetical protein